MAISTTMAFLNALVKMSLGQMFFINSTIHVVCFATAKRFCCVPRVLFHYSSPIPSALLQLIVLAVNILHTPITRTAACSISISSSAVIRPAVTARRQTSGPPMFEHRHFPASIGTSRNNYRRN